MPSRHIHATEIKLSKVNAMSRLTYMSKIKAPKCLEPGTVSTRKWRRDKTGAICPKLCLATRTSHCRDDVQFTIFTIIHCCKHFFEHRSLAQKMQPPPSKPQWMQLMRSMVGSQTLVSFHHTGAMGRLESSRESMKTSQFGGHFTLVAQSHRASCVWLIIRHEGGRDTGFQWICLPLYLTYCLCRVKCFGLYFPIWLLAWMPSAAGLYLCLSLAATMWRSRSGTTRRFWAWGRIRLKWSSPRAKGCTPRSDLVAVENAYLNICLAVKNLNLFSFWDWGSWCVTSGRCPFRMRWIPLLLFFFGHFNVWRAVGEHQNIYYTIPPPSSWSIVTYPDGLNPGHIECCPGSTRSNFAVNPGALNTFWRSAENFQTDATYAWRHAQSRRQW